jgi:hypothetical protein
MAAIDLVRSIGQAEDDPIAAEIRERKATASRVAGSAH